MRRCAEGRGLARHCGRRYLRRVDRALCPEGEGGRDLQLEAPLFALWGRGDRVDSNAITGRRMPELCRQFRNLPTHPLAPVSRRRRPFLPRVLPRVMKLHGTLLKFTLLPIRVMYPSGIEKRG